VNLAATVAAEEDRELPAKLGAEEELDQKGGQTSPQSGSGAVLGASNTLVAPGGKCIDISWQIKATLVLLSRDVL